MSVDKPGCRVAICDDQEGFRELLALALALEPDFEVVGVAATGVEAIELANGLRPDVLLLDIAMPEMDGLEALPLIRRASPQTQVVMLTGVTAESVRRRAIDGGACLYIEKGIDLEDLAAEIRRVCARIDER